MHTTASFVQTAGGISTFCRLFVEVVLIKETLIVSPLKMIPPVKSVKQWYVSSSGVPPYWVVECTYFMSEELNFRALVMGTIRWCCSSINKLPSYLKFVLWSVVLGVLK